MRVDDNVIPFSTSRNLPIGLWKDVGGDIVLESGGRHLRFTVTELQQFIYKLQEVMNKEVSYDRKDYFSNT